MAGVSARPWRATGSDGGGAASHPKTGAAFVLCPRPARRAGGELRFDLELVRKRGGGVHRDGCLAVVVLDAGELRFAAEHEAPANGCYRQRPVPHRSGVGGYPREHIEEPLAGDALVPFSDGPQANGCRDEVADEVARDSAYRMPRGAMGAATAPWSCHRRQRIGAAKPSGVKN